MALGKKEFIVYERIRKSDACGGSAEWWQQAKPLKKEEGSECESERQRRLRRRCGGMFLCSLKNMEVGKWLEEPLEEWQQRMKCMSGRSGGIKINVIEGVMLFFWYTVGNIINIPSIPCY